MVDAQQNNLPISDSSNPNYSFQYTTVTLSGTVWSFEHDGSHVSFGGPVGLIHENSRENAISISNTGVELLNDSDVLGTSSEDIRSIIQAAEQFCEAEGYIRTGKGANMYSNDGQIYLIGFCSPAA